ncbi:autotransporter outer membrane beta-barrel domain-containing protein, partial [Escherichia coli]
QGDRLVVTGTAEGNHRVYVADTGVSPEAGADLTLVTTGGGDAAFVLGNEGGMVDIGTYEYTLKKDTDNTGGNSWRLTEYVAPEPPTPPDTPDTPDIPDIPDTPDTPDTPVTPPSDVSRRITPSTAAVLSMAAVTPLVWDAELDSVRGRLD